MTNEQTEEFMFAVVVVTDRMCKSVRHLQLVVVTNYICYINPIINQNSVSSE
jgi:hypothetical protein